MLLLGLSLLALLVGPAIYKLAKGDSLSALDGFVMVTIAGLAAVHIIPHSMEAAGGWALLLAIVGFIGPGLVERSLHRAADRVHGATMILAVAGLVVHGFFDGVGLSTPDLHSEGPSGLAIAVLLHRLPVAITLWALLIPRGPRVAVGVLIALGGATVIGYSTANAILWSLSSPVLGLVQGLIAGSVLHVVVHRPGTAGSQPSTGRSRLFAGCGALVGIAAVAAFSSEHFGHHGDAGLEFGTVFLTIAVESAPALLIAFAIAGVVQVVLPTLPLGFMRTGRSTSEAARGVAFGLPLPICSCGVIPIYQSLISQSVPATAAMAFLVATPELGLDAVILSLPLLGGEMAALRVVAAVLVALLVGRFVGRFADRLERPRLATVSAHELQRAQSWRSRLRMGLAFGFGEIVDHTGPWIVLGIAIAAAIAPVFDSGWVSDLPFGVDVIAFALLGMPAYVCASGATPMVAVLMLQGVSPGAALAFLLAGPATNITTFGILAKLHGRGVAFRFAAGIAGAAIALGLIVNMVAGELGAIEPPPLDDHAPSLLEIAILMVLTLIFALSVLRQGPRGIVAQILSPFEADHGHDHDHSHSHSHGH